ncbi:solute carrier family 22 member 7-like isoform X1 [Ornithodoros turicata]|uniref:solute carrier family 22 member 7-like isoform X1 n=1 Tax=Ornithodoros turicata TaxID=34597 RepID=UPI003138D9FE
MPPHAAVGGERDAVCTSIGDEDIACIFAEPGLFQQSLLVYGMLATMTVGMHNQAHVLIAPKLNHWCAPGEDVGNMTVEEWKAANIPQTDDGDYKECEMYDGPLSERRHNRSIVRCKSWQYINESGHGGTITEEWNLVCYDSWLWTASVVMFHIGSAIGFIIAGVFLDRIGRKPVIRASVLAAVVSGFAMTSATTVHVFICLRFLLGAGVSAHALSSYVLLMEVIPTDWQGICGVLLSAAFGTGFLVVNVLGQYRLSWRLLQLTIAVLSSTLLTGFIFVQESPRWLISRCGFDEADKVVKSMAQLNGRNKNKVLGVWLTLRLELEKGVCKARGISQSEALKLILSTPLMYRNLIASYAWLTISMVTSSVNRNFESIYTLLVSTAVTAYISKFFAFVGIEKFGRRSTLSLTLLFMSVSAVGYTLFGKENETQRVVFLSLALFFTGVGDAVIVLYVTELNPISLRVMGLCFGSLLGRLGNVFGNLSSDLVRATSAEVPWVLFTMTCSVAGLLVTLLPETRSSRFTKVTIGDDFFHIAPLCTKKASAKERRKEILRASRKARALESDDSKLVITGRSLVALVGKPESKPQREPFYAGSSL